MNDAPAFKVFRLVSTFEIDTTLYGDAERVRLELFRAEGPDGVYRLRLWHTTFVQSVVSMEEESDTAEMIEWQTLEDLDGLLEPSDMTFEASSQQDAERRALDVLKRRLGEAAWAKH